MSLPWIRMETNLPSHPKTLDAIGRKGGKAAMCVYQFSIEWSGAHATDGHIPRAALPMIHGTPADAKILSEVHLWDPDPTGNGWWIHNYAQRQEASDITAEKRRQAAEAGRRSGCVRRGHPADCDCWRDPTLHLVDGNTR